MFICFPPCHHHHLHHHHPSSLSTTLKTLHGAPPLSGRMWAQIPTPQLTSEVRTKLQSPLPFPKGCGQLILAWRRNQGDGKMRGDSGIGRPTWYVKPHRMVPAPASTQPSKSKSPMMTRQRTPRWWGRTWWWQGKTSWWLIRTPQQQSRTHDKAASKLTRQWVNQWKEGGNNTEKG